jgi:predicted nuclease of predicted toxin-antitoxin system
VIKIVVDMNLPPRWVPVLKAEGYDAVHWSTIGSPGAADSEILTRTSRNQKSLKSWIEFKSL